MDDATIIKALENIELSDEDIQELETIFKNDKINCQKKREFTTFLIMIGSTDYLDKEI